MTVHGDATSHADTCLSHQAGTPRNLPGSWAGVPRIHQFLVTLTVQTITSNPHALPGAVLDIDNDGLAPVVVTQRDDQHLRDAIGSETPGIDRRVGGSTAERPGSPAPTAPELHQVSRFSGWSCHLRR